VLWHTRFDAMSCTQKVDEILGRNSGIRPPSALQAAYWLRSLNY